MKLRTTTCEHPGSANKPSQDRLAVVPFEDESLLCVLSDGVGSARDPERCAERVVRLVADNFSARPRQWAMEKFFRHLVNQANESLLQEGFYLDGTISMQATLAVAYFQGDRVYGCNVGDSPILHWRGGKVVRMTRDHISKDADGYERVTQTIGMGPNLQPHYFEQDLLAGDSLLLTSDGLTKLLRDEAIGKLIDAGSSARGVVQDAFQQRKSPTEWDDISTILIRVESIGAAVSNAGVLEQEVVPHPAKGKIFDGYTLLHSISGNDRVWLAKKEDRRYVIKFIPQEAETDDSGILVARFSREIWNACRLHGDFFVPSFRAENGSSSYYIMDYVEAPSLKLLLKTRKFSAEEAIELGRFLCRAGQYLLQHELVHGDIKPDNLLVFRAGDEVSFKLLDLGLANTVFTQAFTSGTPSYLAPERYTGALLTERSEIFSIGATLYESLGGRPPFGDIERFQVPMYGELKRLSRLNPNVPLWLEGVIGKCLALKPDDRYQCYSELLFAMAHPELAPLPVRSGPLLERNPLLFYQIGFWIFLALTLLLTLAVLSLCHK